MCQDIAGTLATEEAEGAAQVAKLRSALESVDHKRRKAIYLLFQHHLCLILSKVLLRCLALLSSDFAANEK